MERERRRAAELLGDTRNRRCGAQAHLWESSGGQVRHREPRGYCVRSPWTSGGVVAEVEVGMSGSLGWERYVGGAAREDAGWQER